MFKSKQTIGPSAPPAQPPQNGVPPADKWIPTAHIMVVAPLKGAVVSGVWVATCALSVVILALSLVHLLRIDWVGQLIATWLVIWLFTSAVSWFRERARIMQRVYDAELRDKTDYDGDGLLGRPDPEPMFLGKKRTKRSLEAARQVRFEAFIKALYVEEDTTVETIRGLPEPPCGGGKFTEGERRKFSKALRESNPPLIRMRRGGDNSPWDFIPASADECIKLARERVMWRIMDGTLGEDEGGAQ